MEQTCLLCGKDKRWSQRFCGALCSSKFESGKRPKTGTVLVISKGPNEYVEAILTEATREEARVVCDASPGDASPAGGALVLSWHHVLGRCA